MAEADTDMAGSGGEPVMDPSPKGEENGAPQISSTNGQVVDDGAGPGNSTLEGGEVVGSAAMRPVFLGNLENGYGANEVKDIFERPICPPGCPPDRYGCIPVDRVDLKRGYCFVFLKDATSEADKQRAENFVSEINGMSVDRVTSSLRAEFARGDGRVKRKEDDRRKKIQPSETLFVVNFHEETTKREDLQMLFEPFGELVRIDLKRNYAFVQFRTIDEAKKAKEVTNGGKLDQSVLTVEYVARQRGEGGDRGGGDRGGGRRRDRGGGDRGDRGGGDRWRGDDRGGDRYGDRRGGDRYGDRRGGMGDRGPPSGGNYHRGGGGPPPYDNYRGGGGGYRGGGRDYDRRDDRPRGGGGGFDNRRGYRDRSPGGYRDRSPPRDRYSYRGRSRSRSRSPPRYRSRSPRGGKDEYDDRRGGGGGGSGGGQGGGGGGGGYYSDRDRDRERDSGRGGRSPDRYRESSPRGGQGGGGPDVDDTR